MTPLPQMFMAGPLPGQCSLAVLDSTRGRIYDSEGGFYARSLLSTDALGTMTLTLTNVVVGSRYRIERQGDGSLATPTGNAEGVAGAATVVITLDYYGIGSANNNLRIRVRKSSAAPYYKTFESLLTIGAAAQSVYIAQIPDQ